MNREPDRTPTERRVADALDDVAGTITVEPDLDDVRARAHDGTSWPPERSGAGPRRARWALAAAAVVAVGAIVVLGDGDGLQTVPPAGDQVTAPIPHADPPDPDDGPAPDREPPERWDPPEELVPEGGCAGLTDELVADLVGIDEAEAGDRAADRGMTTRVVERDGRPQSVTFDLRCNRVNLAVADGRVIGVAGLF